MPGELTNVWAKAGAKPAGPFTCESLLSPTVAMQGGTAAAQLPEQSPWNIWDQEHTALASFGMGSCRRVYPVMHRVNSVLEMQELDLRMLKGYLGFIPTPPLRHLASNHPKGFWGEKLTCGPGSTMG